MNIDRRRNKMNLPCLMASPERAKELKTLSVGFPSVSLSVQALGDLEMILSGAYAPLEGFLSKADYESVLDGMRLADGRFWPMPVCLEAESGQAAKFKPGDSLALRDGEGFMLAVMHLEEAWKPDLAREARAVYGTDDPAAHPGVRRLLERPDLTYLSGRIEGLHLPQHVDFGGLRHQPADVLRSADASGWVRVLGVTLDCDLHGGLRESLMLAARRVGGSILALSTVNRDLLGWDDHFTSVRCMSAFAEAFPRDMLRLTLSPMCERLAGPRQALLEACVFGNFGCTHMLVRNTHADPAPAGQTPFYPGGEAQRLVALHAAETGVECVAPEEMVYLESRAQFVPASSVPSDDAGVRSVEPSELRRRLEFGLEIPTWCCPPGVVRELRHAFPPRSEQGFTIFITGYSGAGKSTLAKILHVKLMELRQRPVTLLDGDIVRKMLSSELGFSREHRMLNIRRMGYVASEITKNRGVAICSPIAPYAEARRDARAMVEKYGGFIEVHLCTPIEVCIQRDRKGIYAKARAGLIKGVTGIDDPYETPAAPELRLDTTSMSAAETAHEVLLFLEQGGYIG
ncbi:bifunctional sulfate adenylyltransferase/adenylylsulfate kinase [Fundidesulfovibrio agrisoli]|uniref:bifunctional sulfate adenylyltransferase/adenylylsulfate kinase n=1 Tax=Fundidesulfovibrio agrisoli TaxID=2922717 RepID=UPI001FAC6666|nr:bifunctional sulfate adenylyltransferase/adenylylsulfate kinase [Fundidesulfovibrio agrisoli]